jgi:phage FluMu protein Com
MSTVRLPIARFMKKGEIFYPIHKTYTISEQDVGMKCWNCGKWDSNTVGYSGIAWMMKCPYFRCKIITDIYFPKLTKEEVFSMYYSNNFDKELIIKD